jgi:hypothetical protein
MRISASKPELPPDRDFPRYVRISSWTGAHHLGRCSAQALGYSIGRTTAGRHWTDHPLIGLRVDLSFRPRYRLGHWSVRFFVTMRQLAILTTADHSSGHQRLRHSIARTTP